MSSGRRAGLITGGMCTDHGRPGMTTTQVTPGSVRSADGTAIAYERAGSGPAVILVDAAGGYREFGPMRSLAGLLAADFTVYAYDRRGRGESGDTPPYALEREIEDLAALIEDAGGSACVYAYSSGGLLALHAAAGGLDIPKLALFEPPINATEEDRQAGLKLTAEMTELLDAGRRGDAAEHFNRSIGVPDEMLAEMRTAPFWPVFEAVAHTLLYDCAISNATSLELLGSVTTPTLVLDSQGSSDDLTGWAAQIAKELPNGTHRSLAGAWHGVPEEDLAPVLTEHFRGSAG
jgi:pimeloyl-ACP methyl ester carboxylesterase